MADFVAVLKKTLDGLGETTPEIRARVYDKARSTIAAKLAAIDPPPPAAMAERQKRALEDAIASVERDYAKPAPAIDPLAELENIFSSIDRNRNQPNHVRPGAKVEPAKPEPARNEPARTEPARPAPTSSEPARTLPVPTEPRPEPARAETPKPPVPDGQELTVSGPVWPRPKTEAIPMPPPRAPEAPGWEPDREPSSAKTGGPGPETEDDAAASLGPEVHDRDFAFSDDDETRTEAPYDRPKRGYGRLVAAGLIVLVAGGVGYAWWSGKSGTPASEPAKQTADSKPAQPGTPAKPAQPAPASGAAPSAATPEPSGETSQPTKFTQRLLPDGKETDPGPASGANGVGEGTSIVALTTQPPAMAPAAQQPSPTATPPAAGAAPNNQQQLAVGQKAIFYEERTNVSEGSAEPGNIVWSLVQESPGGDAPPEPTIHAEATIPGKNIQLRMTIRRNTDQTLPASHIIEMIFLTPDGFEGGGIDNVLRIAMKGTEQEAGSPLIGIPAKIGDGFFLVALNDTKADEDANLTLLRKQDWIDIPVVYKSGRRALLTMEKGIPGEKVFDDALKAWQAKTSG
ncbi:hypothetical protein [Mesorhizobium sp. SP-1A]|uniref:hypothetical protein n=1 Tax=Mesorhizobium sp. SP-1A TaxID=3077840 RepID=UPI0028F70B94|nr:hypothetical protein [Mesorhizobium sp. SP-1A]